ncbi:hypothetical protein PDESU_05610 [Pontiella desulfatans]|uniref:YARHG domain-containing protein n=1 Tax=Pontiella desulfatans TaxID=2750659 RepID=A0A6C2UCR1_PONDE|nr:hypothetical protein [Pontiella desulfatans]VGO17016.1 hypothetical protein PDESU_05610 [Pontiella desulfatans]
MKTRTLLIAIGCIIITGMADANTLKDKPPTIFYPEGHYLEGWPRTAQRDMFGYNYQQHKFVGYFANVYLGGDGLPPYGGNAKKYYQALVAYGYFDSVEAAEEALSGEWFWGLRDVRLYMRWNDAWLSNQDRGDDSMGDEPDGNLDRHYGFPSYINSGAELTQFQVEPIKVTCKKGKTKTVYLYYYSKIVAVPDTAVLVDGIWYTEDGEEMGPQSYGQFAKVKEFLYDPLENGDPCMKPCKPRVWKKEMCEMVRPDHCWTGKRVWGDNGNGKGPYKIGK